MASVEAKILRYKKYLARYQEDKSHEKEVYHILKKLDNLPVTLDHLQSTGIGKAVNVYRKYNGDIGDEAKSIVAKWKCLVPGIRTPQPSPSIHCETISETSYHTSELRHQQLLPVTQRVPYLESSRTQRLCSVDSVDEDNAETTKLVSDENHNCPDENDQLNCDRGTCDKSDGVADQNSCPGLNGEQVKDSFSCQKPADLRKGKTHDKEKTNKTKHRRHASTSHKHSKHSNGESKNKESKSRKEKSSSSKASDLINHEHCPSVEGKLLDGEAEISVESSLKDAKQSSPKEDMSSVSCKHASDKETMSKGHRVGSSKVKSSRDHKASSHRKHRSKDHSGDSKERHSKDHKVHSSKKMSLKSSSTHNEVDASQKNKKHDKVNVDKKHSGTSEGSHDESSVNASQNDLLTSVEKLGSFKEKLSKFSNSLKKVGGPLKNDAMSLGQTKDCGPQRSELQPESLNDELLNDILMNEKDPGYLSVKNEVKLKHDPDVEVGTLRRQCDCDSEGPSIKKRKVNASKHNDNNEKGLSFEDLLTFDKELFRKQAKKPKLSTREQHSTASQQSSRSKTSPENLNKEKSRKHGRGVSDTSKKSPDGSHANHSRSGSLNSDGKSTSSKHKSSSTWSKTSSSTASHQEQRSSNKNETEFSVPPPPDKKMKLTSLDIQSCLPEVSLHSTLVSQSQGKELNKTVNKVVASEDEFLSKRNTRTQVYSGKRTNLIHEVPRLRDACLNILMDNIDDIEHVGDVPFEVLKPVLERCTSSQLYTIEEYNPQFIEKSCYLWEKLCWKEFRKEKPREDESWRELYLRKHNEREAHLKRLTTHIAVSFAKKQEPVKKTKLAFVDSVAKPPRNVLRQQKKHGTAGLIRVMDPLSSLSSRKARSTNCPF